jgi:hypothetical protein
MGPRPACCYRLTPHPAPNPAQIDLDALEDAQLDMEDLLADAEEINEVRCGAEMVVVGAERKGGGGKEGGHPPFCSQSHSHPLPPFPLPPSTGRSCLATTTWARR